MYRVYNLTVIIVSRVIWDFTIGPRNIILLLDLLVAIELCLCGSLQIGCKMCVHWMNKFSLFVFGIIWHYLALLKLRLGLAPKTVPGPMLACTELQLVVS